MKKPRATYRLQFNKNFTFRDALALVDYFAALGISHLYASPFLMARPGSTHGYDITDHNRLNPEIGTEKELDALVDALKQRDMGLILDFVPNHMGVGSDNPWWIEVLEWGESAPVAPFFDIDWDVGNGKVLLPVLGDQYGAVLLKGEVRVRFNAAEGTVSAWYWDHRFPIAPADYAELLQGASVPEEASDEYQRIVDEFARLALEARRRWRPGIHAEVRQLQRDLAALARDARVAAAIGEAVETVNGATGKRATWRPLHALLERQAYRLAYWRVAADEINYRRFFNINDLAGLRVELPELFDRMHRLVFRLIDAGKLDGLRIDHIDGLFDPREYCERLQARYPDGLYVIVEKILAHDEALPDWPIAGTTGYEFTNAVLGLLADPAGEAPLLRRYARLARAESFDAVLYDAKKRIMQVNLASEMGVLAREFHRLSSADWGSRDFTLNLMRQALEEVIAFFPVYRTYVLRRGISDEDRARIAGAVAEARHRSPANDTSIFDFLLRLLTGDLSKGGGGGSRVEALRLAMRLQQVTGPVMAKGFEDTALYRWFPLLALNEVGGEPRRFGVPPEEFHEICRVRAERWPHALSATATHDTKRGEDARARIALLSEIPREWGVKVAQWRHMNAELRGGVDHNHEWLFYQALFGAWTGEDPALADRMAGFMQKAVREGKERSGWANPDLDYEASVETFIRAALKFRPFADDMAEFVGRYARLGAVNSLAQTLLKLAAPGVPDVYQGAELWDFSLVDPDNRRPVDFALRRRLLEAPLDGTWEDGREKLFLIRRALALRPEGAYVPLAAEGAKAQHLFAFTRGGRVLAALPRLVVGLGGDWAQTRLALPRGRWRDALAERTLEGTVAAAELFRPFPVALLEAR
jgi:(1->4)-alpha-D-glucan 1-alpha-D-glucosylmutase